MINLHELLRAIADGALEVLLVVALFMGVAFLYLYLVF